MRIFKGITYWIILMLAKLGVPPSIWDNPIYVWSTTYEQKSLVHQNKDGKWYFWDEGWAHESAPFETQQECETALQKYTEFLDGITVYTPEEQKGENKDVEP